MYEHNHSTVNRKGLGKRLEMLTKYTVYINMKRTFYMHQREHFCHMMCIRQM